MVTSGSVSTLIILLEIVAYAVYARGVVRGEVVLSRASWLIWAPLLWLTVLSSWQGGAGMVMVKTLTTAVGVTVIAVLALRFGTGGWSRSDRVCFVVTLVGIAGWAISADPVVGLALFILADGVGAIPTIRDVLRDPGRERPAYWLICTLTCALSVGLISAHAWSWSGHAFVEWAYPLYVTLVNLSVLAAMASRAGTARSAPAAATVGLEAS